MSNTNVGVIVGRFQPITLEQIERLFIPALSENDAVVVILGSSDTARDDLNPFTASQREDMILQALNEIAPEHNSTKVVFKSVRDYWSNRTRFLTAIQEAVSAGVKEIYGDNHRLGDSSINLYGVDRKDGDSEYLSNFPTWTSRVEAGKTAQSFEVMKGAYNGEFAWTWLVAQSTFNLIEKWMQTEAGERIQAGHEHLRRYRSKYDPLEESAGHALQFMTVDNVVIHKGHILLVRRRSHPGKGLWALPGGFLESYETTVDGAKRELQEETRLRVKDEWQAGFKHFDHPHRSRRGRTLTFAYKWEIPAWRDVPQLSPEKGFEREVTKVQWFPLSEVINDMSDLLFEDHLDIIESLAY